MARVLMDADCLIKITRAGFKEHTARIWSIHIPHEVRREVVDHGGGRPEVDTVRDNLDKGMLQHMRGTVDLGGDDALVEAFNAGGFDFIATDDKRLIRRLRNLGIGCVVPGLILHHLVDRGRLDRSEGLRLLEVLSRSISSDEYQIARFLLRGDG